MNVTAIMDLFNREAQEQTIPQFTAVPGFPEARLTWMAGYSIPQDRLIAAGLIVTGLSMHDRIDGVPKPETLPALRKMQTDVLGGDFYSSRFYQLLGTAGDVDFVALFCARIIEVNRQKTIIYEKARTSDYVNWEDYAAAQLRFRSLIWQCFDLQNSKNEQAVFYTLAEMMDELEWLQSEWQMAENTDERDCAWFSYPVQFRNGSFRTHLERQTASFLERVKQFHLIHNDPHSLRWNECAGAVIQWIRKAALLTGS